MCGHHKAKNWGCPDTVDTNGSSPMATEMENGRTGDGLTLVTDAYLAVEARQQLIDEYVQYLDHCLRSHV